MLSGILSDVYIKEFYIEFRLGYCEVQQGINIHVELVYIALPNITVKIAIVAISDNA